MSDQDGAPRRVKFWGPHDLAVGAHLERVAELVEQLGAANDPGQMTDVIELHNVLKFLEHGLFPSDYTESDRAVATSRIGQIRSAVARFFAVVDDANCATSIGEVPPEYHSDLLELLGRNKAFERCSAAVMLHALDEAGVRLGEMLACEKLVAAYDAEMREAMRDSPRNAEHLVRHYLQGDRRDQVHLPTSLEPADVHDLLERYLDSPDANLNYVRLIETAPVDSSTGIDAQLKLRAKRRAAQLTQVLFEGNTGFKTGAAVAVSETQYEPAECEMDDSDGLIARLTYSKRWLDETCDNPSVLNNFQHLFAFADAQVLLTAPSYPAQLGVLERVIASTGKRDYQGGAAFRAIDMSSHIQTQFYQQYLETKGKDLEGVIAWFFDEYLVDEFGAVNFSFRPSSVGASYLERVRHILAEMEGVLTQFTVFVENGELDRDLLAMSPDLVRYRQVPSLLPGKYIYPTKSPEITAILHVLFSDQSTLTYINEDLKGDHAAALLLANEVAYDDFHDYQKPAIDQLITFRILENTGERVQLANPEQFLILGALFATQACSYYHLSSRGRAAADALVAGRWAERQSFLLTDAEGQYFNYFLNRVDFDNGPQLRNKYSHGSQDNSGGEDAHIGAYITALKLMIALVIKLNDDFCLSESAQTTLPDRR